MTDATRMRELLRYANYAKVAEALGVSRSSVAEWAKGRDVSPYRLRQVESLLIPEHEETPRPEWAEGLEAQMSQVTTKIDAFAEWHRRADEREEGHILEAATQGALEAVRQFFEERGIRPVADGEPDPSPAAGDHQSS